MRCDAATIYTALCSVLLLLSVSNAEIEVDTENNDPPNIVVVVVDDVGWADLSYTGQGNIPTPNIDRLAESGTKLTNHFVHATCTPTRASLLTGLYSYKTGLSFAIVPGSPAGLDEDMVTMPRVFRDAGYRAQASGKWHLGYSQQGQLPTGRGFEKWIGCVTCNFDVYSKQTFELPWIHLGVDWAETYENKTYLHYADPRHATHAITENAIDMMETHAQTQKADSAKNPLFLYVAYTAAHSPLQPMERHLPACRHIPHVWRRDYCGLVAGLDEGVQNLTDAMHRTLGSNSILVFMSDNGGSPWFGGLNTPFRGGKTSPLEGGVHVPAFVVDFTEDRRYLGVPGREYEGMFHVSDWMPTLARLAGIPSPSLPPGLDGLDQSAAIRDTLASPRTELVFDLIAPEDSFFSEGMISFRRGDIKIIDGLVRDKHWYTEAASDRLNTTDETWISIAGEVALRVAEWFFGDSKFDTAHHILAHGLVMHAFASHDELLMYNITADPEETTNLSPTHPALLKDMLKRVQTLLKTHVQQQPIWLILNHEEARKSWVPGDCSMNPLIPEDECFFLHTWAADNEDPLSFTDRFASGREHVNALAKAVVKMFVAGLLWILCLCSTSLYLLFRVVRRVHRRIVMRRMKKLKTV